jgi:hypothetical protein
VVSRKEGLVRQLIAVDAQTCMVYAHICMHVADFLFTSRRPRAIEFGFAFEVCLCIRVSVLRVSRGQTPANFFGGHQEPASRVSPVA